MTGSENYMLDVEFLIEFVVDYFQFSELSEKKKRMMSEKERLEYYEEKKAVEESNMRLRRSIRNVMMETEEKKPGDQGEPKKKYVEKKVFDRLRKERVDVFLINEDKFVKLMMNLGGNGGPEDEEREKQSYLYFAKRFWLRMRKDKDIPHDGEVPAEDLVAFLMRSKHLLPRMKPKDFE